MTAASRRSFLAALVALTLAAGPAAAADKLADVKKALPLLDAYLKLPPAERSRFTVAYYMRQDGKPLTAPLWLVDGGERTALPLRADGRLERLPTLAQYQRGKVQVGVEEKTKISISMMVEPVAPPAAAMEARELNLALAQAAAGARKAAGILAAAMPKLQTVSFRDVASGEVEFLDGRRAPLPRVKGVVTYNPANTPGAKTLFFPKVPSRIDIS
ncbi:hypothetical protein [Phenylobacterium sp.]|uniref:hypothetical protein n=1 Tax=Phenylobacterium sp. TaxID=1871053 RepID=UPI003982E95E